MLFSQGTLVMHLSAFKWAVLLTFKENSLLRRPCVTGKLRKLQLLTGKVGYFCLP